MTMYDSRILLARDVNEVAVIFPARCSIRSYRSTRLAEAPSRGQPISVYAPESNAAKMYESLVREILEQDGIHIPILVT
jgi:chromosome partitioning protein